MLKSVKILGLVAAVAVMMCFTTSITKADSLNIAINMAFTGQNCSANSCQSQDIAFNNGFVLSTNPAGDSAAGATVALPNFNLSYNSGAVITPANGAFAINGGAAGSLSGTINWMNLVQGGTAGTFDLGVGLTGISGTPGTSNILDAFITDTTGSGILTFQFTDPNITTVQSLAEMNDPLGTQTSLSGTLATPEPASLCLFGIGLLGLAFAYRRRLQAAA